MTCIQEGLILFLLFSEAALGGATPADGFRREKRQLMIRPPPSLKLNGPKAETKTGNSTGNEAENNATRTDIPADKIINPTTTSQVFFNYGAVLTGVIYGLIGIGYFYGPYSVDAYLADQREKHRLAYLKQRVGQDDPEDEERDYGDYIDEELQAFQDHAGDYSDYHGGDYARGDQGEFRVSGPSQVVKRLGSAMPEGGSTKYGGGGDEWSRQGSKKRNYRQSLESLNQHRGQSTHQRRRQEAVYESEEAFNWRMSELVKVLDMTHEECQAWIGCLQARRRGQQNNNNNRYSSEPEMRCGYYQSTCPVYTRSLVDIVPGDDAAELQDTTSDVTASNYDSPTAEE